MVAQYTKGQLQKLIDAAYKRGVEDGGNLRGVALVPPRVEELIDHSMEGGDHPVGEFTADPSWIHGRK